MAITVDGAASDPTTTASDTSIVVTAPAGSGGRLYAMGSCVNPRTISPPAGWTEVFSEGTDFQTYLWMRADDAAGSYTFTVSGTFNNAMVSMIRLGGAGTNTPTYAHATGPNDTTQTGPNVNAPTSGDLAVWVLCHSTFGTCTSSKGTEQVDNGNATSGCHMAVYTEVQASSGTVAGPTFTTTAFGAKRMFSFTVEPSAAAAAGMTPRRRGSRRFNQSTLLRM